MFSGDGSSGESNPSCGAPEPGSQLARAAACTVTLRRDCDAKGSRGTKCGLEGREPSIAVQMALTRG